MLMGKISTDDGLALDLPFSQAVERDGSIYVSGQVALDPETGELIDGDITAETKRTLKNVELILDAADAIMEDVVKVNLYLVDINEFDAVNEAYEQFFNAPYPARTAVEVADLAVPTGIEIDVIAVR